jgi:hypothetical protein
MLRGSGRHPRQSLPPSSPPGRFGPSALKWANSSSLAQETIERHLAAHEQRHVKQLGGTSNVVPRLVDLVANRLVMADSKTIHDMLADIPPMILQNNIWRWHRLHVT